MVCQHSQILISQWPNWPMYEVSCRTRIKSYAITAVEQPGVDVIDECEVPMYQKSATIELPNCAKPGLLAVLQQYTYLFKLHQVSQMLGTMSSPPSATQ